MQVNLVFVPEGGGEADYSLLFDLAAVPQVGDYMCIQREGEEGQLNFVVRRTWWHLHTPETRTHITEGETLHQGTVRDIYVECEYAVSPSSSETHRRAAEHEGYVEFENSAY